MNFRRGWLTDEPEINLIPMIDILLVIVIFLMVSTQLRSDRGLALQLPLVGIRSFRHGALMRSV